MANPYGPDALRWTLQLLENRHEVNPSYTLHELTNLANTLGPHLVQIIHLSVTHL